MKTNPYTESIAAFTELFLTDENQYLCIYWGDDTIRSKFLNLLIKNNAFDKYDPLFIDLKQDNLEDFLQKDTDKYDLVIIDNHILQDLEEIRTIIQSYLPDIKVVLTAEKDVTVLEDTSYFELKKLTFREYLMSKDIEISIPKVLQWKYDIDELNALKDGYILSESSSDFSSFEKIRADIEWKLYKKDKLVFDEYLQIMANQVGKLYKENEIAKIMGVSRRKVKKYTDILLEHNVIEEVFPFIENPDVELSRHTKYFFQDLSYLHAILGNSYYKGLNKSAVLENFIYLELLQKLGETHALYFWRKKSGTQIQFVLVNNKNNALTPIEIHTGSSTSISKAMRSFYTLYSQKIEHGMLLNEKIAKTTQFEESSFLILPHITI